MIEQRADILCHETAVISGGIVELGRCAVAPIIDRDGAAAGAGQRRYPARIEPIHFFVRRKAMDEHDRLALPFVEIGDLDITMSEMRHAPAYSRSAGLCTKAAAAEHGRDRAWSARR